MSICFPDEGIFSAPHSFNGWRLILLLHPISSKARKEQYLSSFVAEELQIESTSHWQISRFHEAQSCMLTSKKTESALLTSSVRCEIILRRKNILELVFLILSYSEYHY